MNTVLESRYVNFESLSYKMLPGSGDYYCQSHQVALPDAPSFFTEVGTIKDEVHINDASVVENRSFAYQIVCPQGMEKASKVVLLFHGLNEKDWNKYLPWAEAICKGTNSAVVLFPIAFHMQRAPKYWSTKRNMYQLSEYRKQRFPYVVHSSLSNVAISMRLHAMPQRLIWSGLQTYYDVIQFIEQCKAGAHPYIAKDFTFDVFAFSIGGFLAQILKLSNYKNYFGNSKVCLFCSGVTFNRFSPVSKFILDSEANVALYSFLVEHFDKMLQKDKVLNHYINEDHLEGKVFHAMLDFQKMRLFREELFKKYEDQFYAITLKKDTVIPSFEVLNTLKGAFRDIAIKVEEIDFDREYIHENPFPENTSEQQQINEDMAKMFQKVCEFYNN